MGVDEEKRDTALVLASSRRLSKKALADTKPCRICEFEPETKRVVEGLLGTGLAMRPILDITNSILKITKPDDHSLSMKLLEQHRKNHLPIRLFMQREVVERRAKSASIDIEGDGKSIMTPAAYAEIMMNSGAENLINNPELVSPMEGLAAAKTLHEIDSQDQSNLDVARMASQLNKLIIAVKKICSPNQLETIIEIINAGEAQGKDDIDVF